MKLPYPQDAHYPLCTPMCANTQSICSQGSSPEPQCPQVLSEVYYVGKISRIIAHVTQSPAQFTPQRSGLYHRFKGPESNHTLSLSGMTGPHPDS